jgi:hypothetical protein
VVAAFADERRGLDQSAGKRPQKGVPALVLLCHDDL